MIRRRMPQSMIVAFASVTLVACNSARAPVAEPAVGANVAPPGFALPEGKGCSGAIARYRAILDNDLATGHVNRGVFDEIQGEIERAASACAAGREAEATALLRASKGRHGYPG